MVQVESGGNVLKRDMIYLSENQIILIQPGKSRLNNQAVMDKVFKLLKEELESIDIWINQNIFSMLASQELT